MWRSWGWLSLIAEFRDREPVLLSAFASCWQTGHFASAFFALAIKIYFTALCGARSGARCSVICIAERWLS